MTQDATVETGTATAEPLASFELGELDWDLGEAAEAAKDYPVLLTTAYY